MLPRLLAFGAYDPEHPRTRLMLEGYRALGGMVEEVCVPAYPGAGARGELGPAAAAACHLRALGGLRARRDRLGDCDTVLVPYPGHLELPWIARWARARGKQVVFDPFLSLADTAVGDRGRYAPGSAMARGLMAIDRRALRAADRVLADTPEMAAYYAEVAGLTPDRLAVVPVGADERLFDPATEPEGEVAGLEVLFYGSMLPLHGVEIILAARRRLADSPHVSFRLIGDGLVEAEPSVPRERLPGAIARAGICLGIFGESAKAGRVVPHKIYEAMAMGKPIITRASASLERVLGAGAHFVPAGDAEALAGAIRSLAADPAARDALGAAARAAYVGRFDRAGVGLALAGGLAPLSALTGTFPPAMGEGTSRLQ